MTDARQYTGVELLEENRWALAYAAFGVLVFLVCLLANFPYADAISAIVAGTGLKLDYRDLRWHFPFGITLEDVRVSYPAAASAVVGSPSVTLTPSASSLLLLRPGVKISVPLGQGLATAVLSRSGSDLLVKFRAGDLQLVRYPVPQLSGLQITGKLSGSGSFELNPAAPMTSSGSVQLSGSNVRFPLLPGMSDLHFANASARATADHGVVRIERFEARGNEVTLSGQGTIRLAPQLPASSIDVIVKIEPTARGRNELGPLLNLLPYPPDPKRPYHLRGPLQQPSIS